jgi:ferredoxin
LPGRIGKTLLQTAQAHNVDLRGPCKGGGAPRSVQRTPIWREETFGEGPSCFYCHVQIPSQFKHLMPYLDETSHKYLSDLWEEEYHANVSTLACQITLTKDHDGLVVLVPDPIPTDVI